VLPDTIRNGIDAWPVSKIDGETAGAA